MTLAASALGAASSKSVELKVDGLVFINTVLGLNDVAFSYTGEIYGDLWVLQRDVDGAPVLDEETGCPIPLDSDGVPFDMLLVEGKCELAPEDVDRVVELELGRLNGVRVALTNPGALDRHLYDLVNSINASQGLVRDLSGRLAYLGQDDVYYTVDSPRANLALYAALMRWGKLDGEVEIRTEEGALETINLSITLDDEDLDAQGLGYLKRGNPACDTETDPVCGIQRLENGYADFRGFNHDSRAAFEFFDVSFVERTPDDLDCAYADRTEDLWERVLEENSFNGGNIAAFVELAEDTRRIINFIHTTIHDPVPVE
jgi:hypothetical protein